MDNKSEMQAAAVAVCNAAAALSNGRAMMAVAVARNLDMALVATVDGKGVPFALRDYSHKPMKDGKINGKLRNAQFLAIMSQGFGEPDNTADVSQAVKQAFNDTFGASLWMEAHGGAAFEYAEGFEGIVLDDCAFHNVPLAYAFECLNREGELTDTGKTLVERVQAMYSPERGPEMTEEQAYEELFSRRADNVNGSLNRRYGLKTVNATDLLASLKRAAVREGYLQGGPGRAGRTNQPPAPNEVIHAFEAFLKGVRGEGGESQTALSEAGIKALKALKGQIDATIKAIA